MSADVSTEVNRVGGWQQVTDDRDDARNEAQTEFNARFTDLTDPEERADAWDAFRHTYVSGRLIQMGYSDLFVHFLGTVREIPQMWDSPGDANMDLYNNQFGRGVGGITASPTVLAQAVEDAVRDGTLITDAETDERQYEGPEPELSAEDFDELANAPPELAQDDDEVGWIPVPRALLPPWLSDAQIPWAAAPFTASPLILDLDGDGIELTTFNGATTTTFFDIDGDSFAEQTAWITANQDGLLVRDLNENGTIDGVEELFGSPSIDGFALLATLDDNGDHRIDQYDAEWADLLIWKDINGDALTQSGELVTLSSLNIASIDLAGVAASGSTINGNPISHTSTYTLSSGTTRTIVDAWFTHDNVNSYYVGDYTLDVRALFLPTLRGFGELPDLHIAMSLNEDLLELVNDLASGYSLASFDSASGWNEAIEDILYKWADVDGVNPTSRGPNVDARQLEFLEKFFGNDFTQLGQTPNPGNVAGIVVSQAWTIIAEHMRAQLLLQSGADDLFTNEVTYNPFTGEIEGDLALSQAAIIDLEDFATDVGVDTEAFWVEVARFLDATKGFENLTVTEDGWMNTSVVATDGGLTWTEIKDLVNFDSAGATITGTTGNDTLTGTSLGEQLVGLAGNDTLDGLGGDDELSAGSGTDTLYGGTGNDVLDGESDNDTLVGGSGGDIVEGGYGNDTFIYTSGDDVYSDINGTEIIMLPSGITSGNLSFHAVEDDVEGIHSLFVTIGSLGTIELSNHFSFNGSIQAHLETITFADTTTLSLASFASMTTHGGGGNDSIYGGSVSRIDTIYGYAGDDYIQAEDGNDILDGGTGNDRLVGGAGDDTYIASEGFDRIESEGGGTDIIVMPASITAGDVHFIRLNDSPDDLQISIDGLGQIVIDNQFYQSYYRVETVQFSSTSIALTTLSIETIGTSGNDSMSGISSGASTDDVFDGREGNDTMQGGSGNDIYYFSSGQDTIYESTGSSNDGIKFREGLSAGDITMYRGGYQGQDLIFVDPNGNKLTVGANFYNSQYLVEYAQFFDTTTWTFSAMEIETRGTSGNDAIWDNDIGDASRADTIYGYAGNDDLHGGLGNDLIYGGDGADNIYGDADNDTIYGDDGNDNILGGDGDDIIYGGAGDDTIQAQGGTNIIYGGSGSDTIYGYGGTATASYAYAASGITANVGTGSISDGDGGTDTIAGFYNIEGSTYADTITGNGNASIFKGLGGNDTIDGAGGDDILYGGAGADTLTGGSNADTFVFEAATALGASDTITDFSTAASDKLDVSDILSGYDPLTDLISDFVRITDNGTHSFLSIDANGGANSFTQIAQLSSVTNIATGATATEGELQTLITNGLLIAV